MARLGLLALSFLAALTGTVAQPACPNLSVSLKASKQVAPGGSATAIATVKNTGGAAQGNVVVTITLPAYFEAPFRTKSPPKTYLGQGTSYTAPSMVWGRVNVPKGKKLRFKIHSKLNKCQTGVASLDFIAAAYVADLQGNIQCLSQPQGPASVKVKAPFAKHPLGPCPGAAPGPQGSTILAENQAFSGAGDPNARRGRRLTTVTSLDECIIFCGESLSKPYYVSFNAVNGDCSCCKDACGALVPATGTDTYFVPVPQPGTIFAPSPAPTTAPTTTPTQAPTTAATQHHHKCPSKPFFKVHMSPSVLNPGQPFTLTVRVPKLACRKKGTCSLQIEKPDGAVLANTSLARIKHEESANFTTLSIWHLPSPSSLFLVNQLTKRKSTYDEYHIDYSADLCASPSSLDFKVSLLQTYKRGATTKSIKCIASADFKVSPAAHKVMLPT
jgi:hypothetical protein